MVIKKKAAYRALDTWFDSITGQKVAQGFIESIKRCNENISGEICVQLGRCGSHKWLNFLKFRHKWLANLSISPDTKFVTSFSSLPLSRDSVDCVVAPFILELSDQKNPLDEIDRILKPMGYVIFFGINPLSFWGIWLRLKGNKLFGKKIHLRSSLRLKRAMSLRGYRHCQLNNFYYLPPVKNEKWVNQLAFLNEVGKMLWPFPAGFYCFIAQKYVPCSTLNVPLKTKQKVILTDPVQVQLGSMIGTVECD